MLPQLGVLLMKRIPTILADFLACEEEREEREDASPSPPQGGGQAAENIPESPEWTTHLPITPGWTTHLPIRPITKLPPTNQPGNEFMVKRPGFTGEAFFTQTFAFSAPAPAPQFPPVPAPQGWEGEEDYQDDSRNCDEVTGESNDEEGSSPKRAMIELVAVGAVETREFVAGPKLRRRAEVRAEMRRQQGGGGGRGASRREARRLRRA